MDATLVSIDIKNQLVDALALTQDGIGIFDANDSLVYCNTMIANLFGLSPEQATGMTFDSLIAHSFESKSGLNIETESLPTWLANAHELRRSKKFRSFEVDFHNGRYFLVTEHTSKDNTVLTFCTEISAQKKVTADLKLLNDKLSIQASHDSLTGILNCQFFYRSAESELSHCNRKQKKAVFVMLDLDYFKKINDTFGHQCGDIVLKEVSATITSILRDYDIFGRVGGEEFALFLSEVDELEAVCIVERILQKIRIIQLPTSMGSIQISASAGMAINKDESINLTQLAKNADDALYRAKSLGRDRLEIAE